MPQEDEPVQVLVIPGLTPAGTGVLGLPVEMGAKGYVVELISVSYSINSLPVPSAAWTLSMGLSSNPNHQINPPANLATLIQDISVYGVFTSIFAVTIAGAAYAAGHDFETITIPLHGIIRPRRQVLVVAAVTTAAIRLRAEIYYRPKTLTLTELNLIDRKYGLYRRT